MCDHDFVTYIGGDKPFHCNECESTFTIIPGEEPTAIDKLTGKILQDFNDGIITLGEAAQAASVGIKELADAIKNTFKQKAIYDEMHTIGSRAPVGRVLVGMQPARMSCPLKIDNYFQCNNPSIDEIKIQFPDITSVNYIKGLESGFDSVDFEYSIEFVDESIQKVKRDQWA